MSGEEMKVRNNLSRVYFKFSMMEWLSIVVFLIVFGCQLLYINPFVSSWDQVDFALGVERFDLLAMQPHFPGYPFFIFGGKIIHLFGVAPDKSLTVLSILLSASSLLPLFNLLREFLNRSFSMVSAALILTSSYCVIMVNQPMSEGSALAVFWWNLWSLHYALKSKNENAVLLPLAFLSLLLGIRLSYLPFSIGVLYVLYWKVKNKQLTIKKLIPFSIYGILMQMIWILALIISEGSFISFLKLSLAFATGHFTDWGGAVESSQLNIFERFIALVWKNIIWTGISAESTIIFVLFIILIISNYRILLIKNHNKNPLLFLMYTLFLSYFLWALLAQNVEKARHALPLIVLLLFFICIKLFLRKISIIMGMLATLLLCFQTYNSVTHLREQVTEKPAVYKMNEYVEKLNGPVILYTWEETRVLQYLNAPYKHKRIETYDIFRYDSKNYHDRAILLTDKVVKGFMSQGINVKGKIKKLKTFQSNELFDPIYHKITLYQWIDVKD